MPVVSRANKVFIEKSYSFAQANACTIPPKNNGRSAMLTPRSRTGPFCRANSRPASASSANGSRYAPLPIIAPMPRCSHSSSTPSIGKIASRHKSPSTPQIAPHVARDRTGSGSGARRAAAFPRDEVFLVVVFFAANVFFPRFICFPARHSARLTPADSRCFSVQYEEKSRYPELFPTAAA